MDFIARHCTLCGLPKILNSIGSFSCGDPDLDDFFRNDAIKYEHELFGKTYSFKHKEKGDLVSLFTVSNGSIQARQMKRNLRDAIAYPKRLIHNYPSVLIGRLAVAEGYQSKNIGSEMLNFIKIWFSDPQNKTGCRFLAVDAYNNEKILSFYKSNDFGFIFKNETEERESLKLTEAETLYTRMMCFDLYNHACSRNSD